MIAASLHGAPMAMVMHRNGIQLSGTTAQIMNKDARPIVSSLGIEVLEIPSLHDRPQLFKAYARAYELAQNGKPSLIYPVGFDRIKRSRTSPADTAFSRRRNISPRRTTCRSIERCRFRARS